MLSLRTPACPHVMAYMLKAEGRHCGELGGFPDSSRKRSSLPCSFRNDGDGGKTQTRCSELAGPIKRNRLPGMQFSRLGREQCQRMRLGTRGVRLPASAGLEIEPILRIVRQSGRIKWVQKKIENHRAPQRRWVRESQPNVTG